MSLIDLCVFSSVIAKSFSSLIKAFDLFQVDVHAKYSLYLTNGKEYVNCLPVLLTDWTFLLFLRTIYLTPHPFIDCIFVMFNFFGFFIYFWALIPFQMNSWQRFLPLFAMNF